jgi:hypothetical protein
MKIKPKVISPFRETFCDCCVTQMSNFTYIYVYHGENKLYFDHDVRVVLDQHA